MTQTRKGTKESSQQRKLERYFLEFEQQNPRIAEAMRLFGMSIARYEAALNAVNSPLTYQVYSTNPEEQHGQTRN